MKTLALEVLVGGIVGLLISALANSNKEVVVVNETIGNDNKVLHNYLFKNERHTSDIMPLHLLRNEASIDSLKRLVLEKNDKHAYSILIDIYLEENTFRHELLFYSYKMATTCDDTTANSFVFNDIYDVYYRECHWKFEKRTEDFALYFLKKNIDKGNISAINDYQLWEKQKSEGKGVVLR